MKHICGSKCILLSKADEEAGKTPPLDCRRCGWAPGEQKRRMAQGRFEERSMIIDHAILDDGRTDKEIITGLRTLVFPKKVVE